MAYLFKQKLNIAELADISRRPKKVLIYEPEEYLSALYQHYLRRHNFDVKHCPDLGMIREATSSFLPDVLVFSLDGQTNPPASRSLRLLANLVLGFPFLRLVSIGSSSHNSLVKELMTAGVLGHINRQLSRPQDLAIVVKSILQV